MVEAVSGEKAVEIVHQADLACSIEFVILFVGCIIINKKL